MNELTNTVRQALEQYGIRHFKSDLLQNDRQAVFKIAAEGRGNRRDYVLRIYRSNGHDSDSIKSLCQWLRTIVDDTDLIVPEPVANMHGDDVLPIQLDGFPAGSYCTLMRWVKGRRYFRASGPGIETMWQVGQFMARLHIHGRQFDPRQKLQCPNWDCDGLFGAKSPWYPAIPSRITANAIRLFARVRRKAERIAERLGCGVRVFGLIHGDLMQSNYLLHHGRISAIDFADFGRGYFLYDMAITLLMLWQFDRYEMQRAAFLRGYREISPLSAEYEALLDTFLAVRAAVLAKWAMGAVRPNAGDVRWAHKALTQIPKWL